jgi:hypothetical protein
MDLLISLMSTLMANLTLILQILSNQNLKYNQQSKRLSNRTLSQTIRVKRRQGLFKEYRCQQNSLYSKILIWISTMGLLLPIYYHSTVSQAQAFLSLVSEFLSTSSHLLEGLKTKMNQLSLLTPMPTQTRKKKVRATIQL